MKKEDIHWADWHRILIGDAPAVFLVEVFFRTVITYLFLLITLRLMGKRMGGQLTTSELSVMLMLGAIVSVGMQIPDKGIAQGILVLICVLLFQRGFTFITVKYPGIEKLTQGTAALLVKEGVLQIPALKKTRISREQLFAVIRKSEIYNMGEISRVYLEACGLFSIIKTNETRPGLSLIPTSDLEATGALKTTDEYLICQHCGQPGIEGQEVSANCTNCRYREWSAGFLSN